MSRFYSQFPLSLDDLSSDMLNADYWIAKLSKPNDLLMSEEEIKEYNQQSYEQIPLFVDLEAYPTHLSKKQLTQQILQLSSIPESDRFYGNGERVTLIDYQGYLDNLNITQIKEDNRVYFALTVARSNMRTFPVDDLILNHKMNSDIDRFQENAIFCGEVVLVLHESFDKEWFFVQKYNYRAWVKKSDVAIGLREEVLAYQNEVNDRLVMIGKRVRTVYNPEDPRVSDVFLDMGLSLPLTKSENVPQLVDGRNPCTSFIVRMPVKENDGSLLIKNVMIARSEDVNVGYLPMTSANILKLSFKLLGERYGWGNRYSTRDCTGFTLGIYNCFGLAMLRNSDEQGLSALGVTRSLHKKTLAQQHEILSSQTIGNEIYSPGHVMLYIGQENGKSYIIHNTTGEAEGKTVGNDLKGVSVTTIDYLSHELELIKSFRLSNTNGINEVIKYCEGKINTSKA